MLSYQLTSQLMRETQILRLNFLDDRWQFTGGPRASQHPTRTLFAFVTRLLTSTVRTKTSMTMTKVANAAVRTHDCLRPGVCETIKLGLVAVAAKLVLIPSTSILFSTLWRFNCLAS